MDAHRTWLSWSLLLVILAAAPAPAAGGPVEEARASVQSMLQSVLGLARDPALSPDPKRALVERELRDHLDLHALASAALGTSAESFTPEQRVDFAREYERYLLNIFVKQVADTDTKDPTITDAKLDAATGVVLVRALGEARQPIAPGRVFGPREAAQPIPWDFGVRERRGRWQVVSLRINRVSVSENFRAQIASVLERSDPEALIAQLRTRNVADEAENPFEN